MEMEIMENERSKEWVLERVKKLLALGRNAGATDGERDNAMRMAHKLLSRYNLDMAEAESHGAAIDEKRGVRSANFYGRPWARVTASAIARLYFCEYVYVPAERAEDTRHYFIGKESNTTVAAAMAQWVVESIRREGQRRNRTEGTGRNAWLRSFSVGASTIVYRRVDAMIAESAATTAAPGMSLVLASVYATERTANMNVVQSKFARLGNGRTGKSKGDHDGMAAGKRYGESINLNRQVSGTVDRPRLK